MTWITSVQETLSPGWMGSLIGLLGVLIAAVTYFMTRQRAILSYCYSGARILGSSDSSLPSDISIQFRGKEIPRLTRALVVLWNQGERTFTSGHLVKTDRLRVSLKGEGEILAAAVVKTAREVNSIALSPAVGNKHVFVDFEFLDQNDGAVFEVLHTSEDKGVEVLGTIQGLPKGVNHCGGVATSDQRELPGLVKIIQSSKIIYWSCFGVGAVFSLGALAVPDFVSISMLDGSTPNARWPMFIAGALYALLGALALYVTRRKYPKGLRVD